MMMEADEWSMLLMHRHAAQGNETLHLLFLVFLTPLGIHDIQLCLIPCFLRLPGTPLSCPPQAVRRVPMKVSSR